MDFVELGYSASNYASEIERLLDDYGYDIRPIGKTGAGRPSANGVKKAGYRYVLVGKILGWGKYRALRNNALRDFEDVR